MNTFIIALLLTSLFYTFTLGQQLQCINITALPTFSEQYGYCDGISFICKNFLTCVNHNCTSITSGTNCTNDSDCWVQNIQDNFLFCNNMSGQCEVNMRDNNDPCTINAQCLSNLCSRNSCIAQTNTPMNGSCNLSAYTYECNYPQFCHRNVMGNMTVDQCGAPYPVGGNCTEDYLAWYGNESLIWLPNHICVGGSICLWNNATSNASCVPLYNSGPGEKCYQAGRSQSCQWNLTCTENSTLDELACTEYPESNPNNCSALFPELHQCAFGSDCYCFTNTSTGITVGKCFGEFGVGESAEDDCVPEMQDYNSCLQKYDVPYRPSTFPYYLSIDRIYAGFAYTGWAANTYCKSQHDSFMCCQNRINSDTYSYSPAGVFSSLQECRVPSQWPSYVVPVIVLGGIVFVVGAIILIYVIVKKRQGADGYDQIN